MADNIEKIDICSLTVKSYPCKFDIVESETYIVRFNTIDLSYDSSYVICMPFIDKNDKYVKSQICCIFGISGNSNTFLFSNEGSMFTLTPGFSLDCYVYDIRKPKYTYDDNLSSFEVTFNGAAGYEYKDLDGVIIQIA